MSTERERETAYIESNLSPTLLVVLQMAPWFRLTDGKFNIWPQCSVFFALFCHLCSKWYYPLQADWFSKLQMFHHKGGLLKSTINRRLGWCNFPKNHLDISGLVWKKLVDETLFLHGHWSYSTFVFVFYYCFLTYFGIPDPGINCTYRRQGSVDASWRWKCWRGQRDGGRLPSVSCQLGRRRWASCLSRTWLRLPTSNWLLVVWPRQPSLLHRQGPVFGKRRKTGEVLASDNVRRLWQ